jgi:hypothetical protein
MQKMNRVKKKLFIMPEEITALDVICGMNAEAYNHPGNKRLRFLISFNLGRYRRAKGRPQKSRVINSIVDQLTYAGCRFVKKYTKTSEQDKNEAYSASEKWIGMEQWEIMPPKEGRDRVAHALRDKRQSYDHEEALVRLKLRKETDDDTSNTLMDSHYIVANAMILNVNLTGRESLTLIKTLLFDAIDSVGASTVVDYVHEKDEKPNMILSKDETVTEILDTLEENSSYATILSIPLPKGSDIFDNQRLPLSRPTDIFSPIWPFSVSLQVGPSILCYKDNIPGENSQDWIPYCISSSNEIA